MARISVTPKDVTFPPEGGVSRHTIRNLDNKPLAYKVRLSLSFQVPL
jgi:hypothetical protein